MSAAPTEKRNRPRSPSSNGKPADVRGLLNEYTRKLRAAADKAQEYQEQSFPNENRKEDAFQNYRQFLDNVKKLCVSARELARYVSQHIEHGKNSELEKIELKLRLTEFEGAINSASQLPATLRS